MGEIWERSTRQNGPEADPTRTNQARDNAIAGKGLSPERREPIDRPSPMAWKESGVGGGDAEDCHPLDT
jgi:hypothetical protein